MSVYNTNDIDILKQCVQSVRTQTMEDFEMIICDDGSTDGTYELLSKVCAGDDRIRLIRNEQNMMAAAARNRCISQAVGEYVAVMDADDYSSRERLEVQTNFLDEHPEWDFVGSGAALFDERGIWGYRHYASSPDKKDFRFVLPFVHASVMFRRKALDTVKGYRHAWETIRNEDYDLFLRMYAAGLRGVNLPNVLYYVREDKATFVRRKYRYRWNEMAVRYRGFKAMGLLPAALPYVVKPAVVGLIPHRLLEKLKDLYYHR